MDLSQKNIVVLTGAGISAESGLKTFRDNDGLWEGHRVEEVATPEAFIANPVLVQDFYNQRRQQLRSGDVNPNAAHIALAEFEKHHQADFLLVTQNVDDLHQRAGSKQVIPMHGELNKSRCTSCEALHVAEDVLDEASTCAVCGAVGTLRPHIVWFGEMPMGMTEIELRLSSCDLFVSIGTSSVVYPAAGFSQAARSYGAECIELNLEPSATATVFSQGFYGPATEIVPDFFGLEKDL